MCIYFMFLLNMRTKLNENQAKQKKTKATRIKIIKLVHIKCNNIMNVGVENELFVQSPKIELNINSIRTDKKASRNILNCFVDGVAVMQPDTHTTTTEQVQWKWHYLLTSKLEHLAVHKLFGATHR